MDSSSDLIPVTFRSLDGRRATLEIPTDIQISALKELLFEEFGIQAQDQRLIYRGRPIQPSGVLSDYVKESGHTIHIVSRLNSSSNSSSNSSNSSNTQQQQQHQGFPGTTRATGYSTTTQSNVTHNGTQSQTGTASGTTPLGPGSTARPGGGSGVFVNTMRMGGDGQQSQSFQSQSQTQGPHSVFSAEFPTSHAASGFFNPALIQNFMSSFANAAAAGAAGAAGVPFTVSQQQQTTGPTGANQTTRSYTRSAAASAADGANASSGNWRYTPGTTYTTFTTNSSPPSSTPGGVSGFSVGTTQTGAATQPPFIARHFGPTVSFSTPTTTFTSSATNPAGTSATGAGTHSFSSSTSTGSPNSAHDFIHNLMTFAHNNEVLRPPAPFPVGSQQTTTTTFPHVSGATAATNTTGTAAGTSTRTAAADASHTEVPLSHLEQHAAAVARAAVSRHATAIDRNRLQRGGVQVAHTNDGLRTTTTRTRTAPSRDGVRTTITRTRTTPTVTTVIRTVSSYPHNTAAGTAGVAAGAATSAEAAAQPQQHDNTRQQANRGRNNEAEVTIEMTSSPNNEEVVMQAEGTLVLEPTTEISDVIELQSGNDGMADLTISNEGIQQELIIDQQPQQQQQQQQEQQQTTTTTTTTTTNAGGTAATETANVTATAGGGAAAGGAAGTAGTAAAPSVQIAVGSLPLGSQGGLGNLIQQVLGSLAASSDGINQMTQALGPVVGQAVHQALTQQGLIGVQQPTNMQTLQIGSNGLPILSTTANVHLIPQLHQQQQNPGTSHPDAPVNVRVPGPPTVPAALPAVVVGCPFLAQSAAVVPPVQPVGSNIRTDPYAHNHHHNPFDIMSGLRDLVEFNAGPAFVFPPATAVGQPGRTGTGTVPSAFAAQRVSTPSVIQNVNANTLAEFSTLLLSAFDDCQNLLHQSRRSIRSFLNPSLDSSSSTEPSSASSANTNNLDVPDSSGRPQHARSVPTATSPHLASTQPVAMHVGQQNTLFISNDHIFQQLPWNALRTMREIIGRATGWNAPTIEPGLGSANSPSAPLTTFLLHYQQLQGLAQSLLAQFQAWQLGSAPMAVGTLGHLVHLLSVVTQINASLTSLLAWLFANMARHVEPQALQSLMPAMSTATGSSCSSINVKPNNEASFSSSSQSHSRHQVTLGEEAESKYHDVEDDKADAKKRKTDDDTDDSIVQEFRAGPDNSSSVPVNTSSVSSRIRNETNSAAPNSLLGIFNSLPSTLLNSLFESQSRSDLSQQQQQQQQDSGLSGISPAARNRFEAWTGNSAEFSRSVVSQARNQAPFSDQYSSGNVLQSQSRRSSSNNSIPSAASIFNLTWRHTASRYNIPCSDGSQQQLDTRQRNSSSNNHTTAAADSSSGASSVPDDLAVSYIVMMLNEIANNVRENRDFQSMDELQFPNLHELLKLLDEGNWRNEDDERL